MHAILADIFGFYLMMCCPPQYALVWADGHHTYDVDLDSATFFATKEEAGAAQKSGETIVTIMRNHPDPTRALQPKR